MHYLIQVVVGDWANEGHGLTETHFIQSTLNGPELQAAYIMGTEKLGFNFSKMVSYDEDDNTIAAPWLSRLLELGFTIDVEQDDISWEGHLSVPFKEALETRDQFSIDIELYMKMYLFVVKLGEATFEYKVVQPDKVNIDGYGLFF